MQSIIDECTNLAFDLNFTNVKQWKAEDDSRVVVGHLPIYFPREIVHAAGGMPVGILGSGDRKAIIKGDAFYQSYICHLPRGVIELALDNHFAAFDGFVFPSICDVIRNLYGMFKLTQVGKFVKYMDFPQNFQKNIGGTFYISEMQAILDKIKKINNVEITPERLNHSIGLFNKNRQLISQIYDIRQEFPWRMSAIDLYHVVRAGLVIPVEEHNEKLEAVLTHISGDIGDPVDKIKVIVSGSFCEQPPAGMIKTIEMAGCYIVDDDFILGSRWIIGDVDNTTDDPLGALADAYINKSTFSSSVYDVDNPKGARIAKLFRDRKADGIIFAAASFCDPALLDRPIMQNACESENIRYISFKYSENTGQFKVIKEQVGAFSDSIKLWE